MKSTQKREYGEPTTDIVTSEIHQFAQEQIDARVVLRRDAKLIRDAVKEVKKVSRQITRGMAKQARVTSAQQRAMARKLIKAARKAEKSSLRYARIAWANARDACKHNNAVITDNLEGVKVKDEEEDEKEKTRIERLRAKGIKVTKTRKRAKRVGGAIRASDEAIRLRFEDDIAILRSNTYEDFTCQFCGVTKQMPPLRNREVRQWCSDRCRVAGNRAKNKSKIV